MNYKKWKKKHVHYFIFIKRSLKLFQFLFKLYISLYKLDHINGKGTYPKVVWPIFAHKDESFLIIYLQMTSLMVCNDTNQRKDPFYLYKIQLCLKWLAIMATTKNIDSCLAHRSKGHMMSFISKYLLSRFTFHVTNFLEGSFVFKVISKISRLRFSSCAFSTIDSKVAKGCKIWWVFKSIRKNVLILSYSSTTPTLNSLPTNLSRKYFKVFIF